jgi:hypothetical protein
MQVVVEMVDAIRVEQRRAPFDPVNGIALRKQEFREIGSVLPRNAGNQGDFLSVDGHCALHSPKFDSRQHDFFRRATGPCPARRLRRCCAADAQIKGKALSAPREPTWPVDMSTK